MGSCLCCRRLNPSRINSVSNLSHYSIACGLLKCSRNRKSELKGGSKDGSDQLCNLDNSGDAVNFTANTATSSVSSRTVSETTVVDVSCGNDTKDKGDGHDATHTKGDRDERIICDDKINDRESDVLKKDILRDQESTMLPTDVLSQSEKAVGDAISINRNTDTQMQPKTSGQTKVEPKINLGDSYETNCDTKIPPKGRVNFMTNKINNFVEDVIHIINSGDVVSVKNTVDKQTAPSGSDAQNDIVTQLPNNPELSSCLKHETALKDFLLGPDTNKDLDKEINPDLDTISASDISLEDNDQRNSGQKKRNLEILGNDTKLLRSKETPRPQLYQQPQLQETQQIQQQQRLCDPSDTKRLISPSLVSPPSPPLSILPKTPTTNATAAAAAATAATETTTVTRSNERTVTTTPPVSKITTKIFSKATKAPAKTQTSTNEMATTSITSAIADAVKTAASKAEAEAKAIAESNRKIEKKSFAKLHGKADLEKQTTGKPTRKGPWRGVIKLKEGGKQISDRIAVGQGGSSM
ncbi:Hypothetical predicted protein [Octopus vulgaris]|uniref:Uncharacterized protein n=1 Tax=Octopus vulgaris TaxID=6645 RepID=A0AA36B688_OCTVU|nr:Hypothetical predicted protein [Octopus vulgaris]